MKWSIKTVVVFLLFSGLLMGCNEKNREGAVLLSTEEIQTKPTKSIYYWKTIFDLKESEKDFLRQHDISKLYIRFFDVAVGENKLSYNLEPIPIATIRFKEQPPQDMTVVPTVYITIDALRRIEGKEHIFAKKLVDRVLAMIKANKIRNVSEVQLDCDWTGSTQDSYFAFCDIVRKLLRVHQLNMSATIRLHQLSSDVPPVDKGVLMLYNTGVIQQIETTNSILSYDDVVPYLNNVNYRLPLSFAYPTFTWAVWFREDKIKAILRNTDFSDTNYFKQETETTYSVIKDLVRESHQLKTGDIIRIEASHYSEISKVKGLVESKLPQKVHNTIIYHLDSLNLSNYTTDEIDNMLYTR